MEETLIRFFAAINANDVDGALACCADDVSCTYPDPGRNWQGKERGRVVMTAIFGQLERRRRGQQSEETNNDAAASKDVYFEIVSTDLGERRLQTREFWGHPNMKITTTYTFTADFKIRTMTS